MKIGYSAIKQATGLAGWSICGSSGIYSPRDTAGQVFGASRDDAFKPDAPNTCGPMFMYLFRRFGYPVHGWDDYKSLVCYFLTTPNKNVILWCNPSSHITYSFGFGLSAAKERECMRAEMSLLNRSDWTSHPLHTEVDTAISAAMTELLRPVGVRDTLYNVLGRVRDDSPYADWTHANYSKQAGYGLGKFDPAKEYGDADAA